MNSRVGFSTRWSVLIKLVSILAMVSKHKKNQMPQSGCCGCLLALPLRLLREACGLTSDFGIEGLGVDEESIHVKDAMGDDVLRLNGHCAGYVEGECRGKSNE